MDNRDTGILLNDKNIKIHRQYFNQMVKLIGINVEYRAPRKDAHFDSLGDFRSKYKEPVTVGCIFNDHPDQKTMKKLGWVAEGETDTQLITVAYDLPDLEVGALFTLPSAIDGAKGRAFRVIRMSTISVFPASITCEVGLEYDTDFETSKIENPSSYKYLSDGEYDEDGAEFLHLKREDE